MVSITILVLFRDSSSPPIALEKLQPKSHGWPEQEIHQEQQP